MEKKLSSKQVSAERIQLTSVAYFNRMDRQNRDRKRQEELTMFEDKQKVTRKGSSQTVTKRQNSEASGMESDRDLKNDPNNGLYGPSFMSTAERRKAITQVLADLDAVEKEADQSPSIRNDSLLVNPDYTTDITSFKLSDGTRFSEEFWLQKGVNYSLHGEIFEAMDYFRQGLRDTPTSIKLIYNFANSYKKLKHYQTAIKWLHHGLSFYPRWVDGLCAIGFSYFNMGDF